MPAACTVTVNVCVAVSREPPTSVAVTVTVVRPSDDGVTVNTEPDTDTVASPGDDDTASKVNASPSWSENAPETSTVTDPSDTRSVRSESVPTATGPSFGPVTGGPTVTARDCVAVDPAASLAVNVTVETPEDTGVRINLEPDSVTVATDGDDDSAS